MSNNPDCIHNIKKLSVIMIDGGFRERSSLIDSLNKQTLSKDLYELLWVEFYDKPGSMLDNKEGLKIITLGNKKSETYHAAVCFNEGIKRSEGELLVFMDADLIAPENLLESIWEEHHKTENMLLCYHRLVERREDHGPNSLDIVHLEKVCYLDHPYNVGGCSSIRKQNLLEINGYEMHSSYQGGYHMCDQNLVIRLKNHGIAIKWHPSVRVYHPWHPGTGKADRDKNAVAIHKDNEMTLKVFPYKGIEPDKNLDEKDYPAFMSDKSTSFDLFNYITLKLSLYQRYKGLKTFFTGSPD